MPSSIKLILGDCITEMRKMEDKSVDLVLTDPPYGIKADKGVGGFGSSPDKARKYADTWDIKPSKEIFDNMLRVSKSAIIFGGNYFTDLLPVNGHWIVWDKTGGHHFNNPFSDCELAWTNIDKKIVKKYIVIQQGFVAYEKERYHPTQKPVALFTAILRDYTKENDLVYDPFFGSGTCALSCKELNREFIGSEISEKYYKIAEQRIKNTQELLI
jgi:site-specific DNA-methyltransferase (adenine-specific)